MTKPYFRQVPNFDYVSRLQDGQSIDDYVEVKNLFKRAKIREDIIGELAYFTKYSIIGDERPDNVAYKFYNDSTLDWVVLLANNIQNIQTEWPLSQESFDTVMLEKYGSYENLYSTIHHYESREIKNSLGIVIIPAGLRVSANYSITYWDAGMGAETIVSDIAVPITNYDYELRIENDKRNIFVLKPDYLNIVFNDLDSIMPYKQGSTQYVSKTLKRGENIRLFQ